VRIDYGNGYYPDYRKVWYGAVHKECIAEIDRLKGILARVNALNDESFDEYEEDGPMDLEDQLECALDKAFPVREGEKHGD
jgi:hypothetical protein